MAQRNDVSDKMVKMDGSGICLKLTKLCST
jgi:hypothetical protein